jgi:hypothetical protein
MGGLGPEEEEPDAPLPSARLARRDGGLADEVAEGEGGGLGVRSREAASDGWVDAPVIARPLVLTDEILLNPERGFHRNIDLVSGRDFHWVREGGHTLARTYVRLDDYRTRDLSPELLESISAGLDAARDAGIKVILRFSYNFGIGEPDASKSQILVHIAQLAPLFAEHEDVIAVMHAGFIGAWGEWHSSTNGLLDCTRDKYDILDAILAALPASRMVQVRYPRHKQEGFGGPLPYSEAWSGSYASRIGHHNDCFLASDTDWGTYPDGTADMWRGYLAADTLYVPMGGETCNPNPPRSSCSTALAEMELLHYSYMNLDYHPDVVSAWSTEGCREEMERRLGYRLAVTEATLPERARPGGVVPISFRIENQGWAGPFNPRSLWVVLQGPVRQEVELTAVDPRSWRAGGAFEVSARLQLPFDLPLGTYWIGLWFPDSSPRLRDDPRFAIRLANEDVWDPETGINALGAVDVDPDAQGSVDPGARALQVLQ